MKLPLHEYVLSLILTLALALLIVRLLGSGLAGVYKFFISYAIVDLLQTVAPFFIPFKTAFYAYFFLVTESFSLCLYALVIFELYSVLFRDLKGIGAVARRYTVAVLGISILIALGLRKALPQPRRMIEQFFYFEIPVVSSLVLFILLLMLFLVYYPIPIHRNALVYSAGYAVYFLSKATILFLSNAGSSAWIRACSTAASIVALLSVVFWAMYLSREGERRTIVAGHRWSTPRAQQQVLQRLYELNESLLRAKAR